MADSGISRSAALPDPPRDHASNEEIVTHLKILREAIASDHDLIVRRLNEFLTFAEFQDTTHVEITNATHNYELGDGIVHRLSSDASRNITGFLAPQVARFAILVNTGTQDINLPNENAGSDAANRIITATGTPLVISGGQSAAIWYDTQSSRWRVLTL